MKDDRAQQEIQTEEVDKSLKDAWLRISDPEKFVRLKRKRQDEEGSIYPKPDMFFLVKKKVSKAG
jgi:hypothetical protein